MSTPLKQIIAGGMAAAGVLAPTVPAEASAAGAPLRLAGTSWFAGGGVPVCGASTATSCAGQKHVGGVSYNWWQCVELPQRFYLRRGWHSGVFSGVGIASQIFTRAAALGMERQANGSIKTIVPGDMIVMNRSGAAGHVVVVERVTVNKDGTRNVVTVGQNSQVVRNPMRWHGGRLDSFWASYSVAGVVHAKKNMGILSTDGGPADYPVLVNGGGARPFGAGHLAVTSTGQVFGGLPGPAPAVSGRVTDAAVTPSGAGYWLLSSAGQIFPYGDAAPAVARPATAEGELVAIDAAPNGYLVTTSTGQVYGPGVWITASPEGYSGRFVDIEVTTGGYWLLTSAGQVHPFGAAKWYGNATTFERAIVAMAGTATGRGYVMVDVAGNVFAFGDAEHLGDLPEGSAEAADIAATATGYVITTKTGVRHTFGPGAGVTTPGAFTGTF
ncbi:CHAP domain-containing protein [Herbidospora sp. NEAU-GS84]|uniref:CHAP domain-containing protein n=1 Tax=Herbidospora solisilvae TaxID=2696284 RepID=A0A7C9NEB1_9ACTN|nr:CHAP domain-containing protein [Herbidospora solisilvae]NAS20718.1 CHAP domain-containing protein [Herbidospora solisilvae]